MEKVILQDMPWIEVAKELGLDVCRSTIKRVVHQHLDIYRYAVRLKPLLRESDMSDCVSFAEWALSKLAEWVFHSHYDVAQFLYLPMKHGHLLEVHEDESEFSNLENQTLMIMHVPRLKPAFVSCFEHQLHMDIKARTTFGQRKRKRKSKKMMVLLQPLMLPMIMRRNIFVAKL